MIHGLRLHSPIEAQDAVVGTIAGGNAEIVVRRAAPGEGIFGPALQTAAGRIRGAGGVIGGADPSLRIVDIELAGDDVQASGPRSPLRPDFLTVENDGYQRIHRPEADAAGDGAVVIVGLPGAAGFAAAHGFGGFSIYDIRFTTRLISRRVNRKWVGYFFWGMELGAGAVRRLYTGERAVTAILRVPAIYGTGIACCELLVC